MRIRELRERRGLTGTELARMTGVTLPAVIGWENGSKTPTTDKLPTIAAVLECEIGDLYDDETLRAASEAARARWRPRARQTRERWPQESEEG